MLFFVSIFNAKISFIFPHPNPSPLGERTGCGAFLNWIISPQQYPPYSPPWGS
jgi:hypothetical protein